MSLWRHRGDRYSTLSIGLHWLMLLLIVAVYVCMELSGQFPRDSDMRTLLRKWHYMLGLTVLGLVALRLVARWLGGAAPPIAPEPPRWQVRSATAVHALLYLLMGAMPMLGWALLSARGRPIPYFGLMLPPLLAEAKASADWLKNLHELGSNLGYLLVAAHAGAALFHHYHVGDNTLRRMGRGGV